MKAMRKASAFAALLAALLLLGSCAGSKCDCPKFSKGKQREHRA
jgi:hypothetical protein